MYIIELIAKILKDKDKKKQNQPLSELPERCDHIFLPIDSTGEIFACSKCGFVVKKQDMKFKPKNPFN